MSQPIRELGHILRDEVLDAVPRGIHLDGDKVQSLVRMGMVTIPGGCHRIPFLSEDGSAGPCPNERELEPSHLAHGVLQYGIRRMGGMSGDCSTGVDGSTPMCATSTTESQRVRASSSFPSNSSMCTCWLKSIQAPVESSASSVWTAT